MKTQIKYISTQEASMLIEAKPDLTIIDARDVSMFKSGHLQNAILIDAFDENAEELLDKLDRNAEYLVYCTTTIRTELLVRMMNELGFTNVYAMNDGISKWVADGLLVTVSPK